MKSPAVGTSVQFFPGGERSPHRQPFAAVVTESGQDGRVKLNLFAPGGGQMRGNNTFHRHIDDPWVSENKQWLAGTDPTGTMPRGCWDVVPLYIHDRAIVPVPPKFDERGISRESRLIDESIAKALDKDEEDEVRTARETRQAEGRGKVIDLFEEGCDVDEIARRVRAYGLKKTDVEELIETRV